MVRPSRGPRGEFPWLELIVAAFVGLPALAFALFAAAMAVASDDHIIDFNGHEQTLVTRILVIAAVVLGACAVFCFAKLRTELADWRNRSR